MPVDMVRPNWDLHLRRVAGSYVSCTCGEILQTQQQVREHWQSGHSDEVSLSHDEEIETLVFKLGRKLGVEGLASDPPVISPLAVMRWLVAVSEGRIEGHNIQLLTPGS